MHEAVPDADRGAPVKAHVPVAGGRLFVRVWPGGTPERAPIILFHDSLGCVHLWRSFPASLARQTGRTVVAYDRLGFGRSDPHPSRLAFDFIASEGPSALGPVLDALAIDRWIGFGHSVGGGMALCAATSVPGCLATITEAAQSFVERRTTDGIRDAMRGFTAPGGLDRIARYHGSKAAWVLASWTDTGSTRASETGHSTQRSSRSPRRYWPSTASSTSTARRLTLSASLDWHEVRRGSPR